MKEYKKLFIDFCTFDFKYEVLIDDVLVRRFDTITGLKRYLNYLFKYNDNIAWRTEFSEKYSDEFIRKFEDYILR